MSEVETKTPPTSRRQARWRVAVPSGRDGRLTLTCASLAASLVMRTQYTESSDGVSLAYQRERSIRVGARVLLAALLGFASPVVAALDLTGTWEGTWKCR